MTTVGPGSGYADDSGEGRWTVEEAINHAVPIPAIAASLFARFVSRQDDSMAMKAVSAMRHEFGGHAVKRARTPPDRQQAPDPPLGRPVYISRLSLADFRSYPEVDLALEPGVTIFVGPNGQGKTNLLEAAGYLATLGSHRIR